VKQIMSADIDPAELARRIEEGRAPAIVDVRSGVEYRAGHVPGAVHIPFWSAPWRGREVPAQPDDEVVVYCGHGPRAMMAAAALRRLGFTNVRLLRGHWAKWKEKLKADS
jgi:rhodanese-related sulfurtransferase